MSRPRGKLIAVAVVGLVVALAAAGIGWTMLKSRLNTITLTAQFDNVAGLFVTNNVNVLGMKVGRVTAIRQKQGYVEVDFTVDKDVKIPADVQAVTLSTSILTDRQIELTPVYTGGPTLKDHDTIGLPRTKTPVEFARTLDMMDRLTTSLRGDGQGNGPLRTLIDSGSEIASGNGEKIKGALGELSNALRLSANGGVQTRDQLTTIIKNLSSLVDAAAANDATLRDFGSSIRQISQILADEHLGSGTTGRQLNNVMTELGQILEKNRDAIKKVVNNGNTALKTTIDHQRDLAELLDVAPLTLDNLYNSIDQTNGSTRVRLMTDRVLFESQTIKEMCNMMGLRQLGCSTGTLQDFGPDFGVSYVLDGLATMGQR